MGPSRTVAAVTATRPAPVPARRLPSRETLTALAGQPTPTTPTAPTAAVLTVTAPVSVLVTASAIPVSGTAAPGATVQVQSLEAGLWTTRRTLTAGADGAFAGDLPLTATSLAPVTLRAVGGTATYAAGSLTTTAVTTARTWPADDVRLTDAQARGILTSQGLAIYSSGGCTTRTRSTCTSFDTIRTQTIRAVVDTKLRSRCALTVNGGTEVGHADGTYSHYNGYKADLLMTSCLTSYVTANATPKGWPYWVLPPITFFNETSHWDLTVR